MSNTRNALLLRYCRLLGELTYHAHLYYGLDDNEIQDYDYDMMLNEARALEQQLGYGFKQCPTQYVDGPTVVLTTDPEFS